MTAFSELIRLKTDFRTMNALSAARIARLEAFSIHPFVQQRMEALHETDTAQNVIPPSAGADLSKAVPATEVQS